MAKETMMFPATRQSSGDMPSFSETIFGFLDENYPSSENSSVDKLDVQQRGDDDLDDDESCCNERKAFWDEQEKYLNGILCKRSSIESRVGDATNEAIKQLKGTINCDCRTDEFERCRDCVRQGVYDHLYNAGFTVLVRKSKWKTCRKIPSGQHTYLEVAENSISNKEEARVIIELNFRAEFEMGRASQEYNQLIKKLPQVYVGKQEKLRKIIKVLCSAAKKCMKDKKMHLAPWRKNEYMQAKWLNNSCDDSIVTTTTTTATTIVPQITAKFPEQMVKSRYSMLTRSLIGEMSIAHRRTVKVLEFTDMFVLNVFYE
ncbi:hypothetical protein RND81_11G185000 [Saponaria officinalis]|uniref:Uncharacterized protein n=1 Tax=Saponaria officinalis TaxID=3572 RepID=A0AAW1HNW8_SAPOF